MDDGQEVQTSDARMRQELTSHIECMQEIKGSSKERPQDLEYQNEPHNNFSGTNFSICLKEHACIHVCAVMIPYLFNLLYILRYIFDNLSLIITLQKKVNIFWVISREVLYTFQILWHWKTFPGIILTLFRYFSDSSA